jgi:hypothetical protein
LTYYFHQDIGMEKGDLSLDFCTTQFGSSGKGNLKTEQQQKMSFL